MSRCDRCGRFIGKDCMEGVDWAKGMQQDGDVAWTGVYYCAYGVGCNKIRKKCPDCGRVELWVMEDGEWICHSCGYTDWPTPGPSAPGTGAAAPEGGRR